MSWNAPLTSEFIDWELLVTELKHLPSEIKMHLTPIIKVLKTSCKEKTLQWIENHMICIEACLDRTWENLNSGYWKDVPIEYRYSYSFCSIVKIILIEIHYKMSKNNSEKIEMHILQQMIKQIDKGILLGAPLPNLPRLLTLIASKINQYCNKFLKTIITKKIEINKNDVPKEILSGFTSVQKYEEPSMESFYRNIFSLKVPAVLTGCMKHWKALQLWHNVDYLIKTAGNRTVPIEIGSRYTEEDWTQNLVTFSEFLRTHVTESGQKIGYLAQHQLFDQIPELKNDIAIPDYCNFSDKDTDEVEQPDINAWLGPAGTLSPLHFDPKNNLLCQVFGYKRVLLYHPMESNNLYPYDTRLLNNTAQVDPLNPDYEKWPEFHNAKGFICYLGPGEMLYIPPKWWHHVTALTASFSVSFWWT